MIEKVRGNTYITDIHGTCTGIYMLGGSRIVMIDSGRYPSDEFMQWLNRERLSVAAIIHTHLHIDHIANTVEIVSKYGCEAFASDNSTERGEYWEELVGCDITGVEDDGSVVIDGHKFDTLYTPGHCDGHMVVITPDKVAFIGDAIMTEDLLKDAKLPYMKDTDISIKSMKRLKSIDDCIFAASHYGIIEGQEIHDAIEANIDKHEELYRQIKKIVVKPHTEDALTDKFLKNIGIWSEEVRNYEWIQSTARRRIRELVNSRALGKIKGTEIIIKL
ncbi:MAG: MBL fold metallo-hydrolase [Firmicutes bacterium]|nr:MBL fold metallo-hydrolase [Bacillota bacterium]